MPKLSKAALNKMGEGVKAVLDKVQPHLAEGKPVRTLKLSPEDLATFRARLAAGDARGGDGTGA